MYEDVSYESILQRMLDRVSSSIDKREGSIIYDALAPAAMELMMMYFELNNIMLETFGDTASREYLIQRVAERGIIPYPATNAILKCTATPSDINIPIGARFSLNELNYIITKKIKDNEYQIMCETVGSVGNSYFGNLIPVNYIHGLKTIQITELLIPGEDEEDTEEIRKRYFETFDIKAYGGNKKDYIQKTNAIAGVGSTKVTPVWNGGGTVLLTITNSEFDVASSTLIQTVQNEIDPTKDGTGVGIAPIGHIVTVKSAEKKSINISASITFQEGFSFNQLKNSIEKNIKEYLLEIRKNWANESASVVRISQIETRILNINGIVDIINTKINGTESNSVLSMYEIPVFGGVLNE